MKYLSLLLLLVSGLLQAVEITTAEGIHIRSDYTTADFKNEITEYSGNVVVTQQNLVYSADVIEEYRNNKILIKLIGVGNPTVFINNLTVEGELSKGTAKKVTYVVEEAKVYLEDYVLIDSEGNTQTSQHGVFLLSE